MKTLVAAVETGSFTAAAGRLGISNKLVSKYIAQLESRVGTRLLHRTTRSLSLTDAGHKYYVRCAELIEAFEELEGSVSGKDGNIKGRLRLAAPSTFGELFMPSLLSSFGHIHPKLTIELSLSDHYVDLASEGFDLALRIGNLRDSGMLARKLAKTELWAVASPNYLVFHPEPQTPSELKDHQCIRDTNMRSANAWPFTVDGQNAKISINGKYLANSARAVRDIVLANEGIGLCPDYVVEADVRKGRLKRILRSYPSLSLDIHAVFLNARYMPAKVRLLLDFLAATFKARKNWQNW